MHEFTLMISKNSFDKKKYCFHQRDTKNVLVVL